MSHPNAQRFHTPIAIIGIGATVPGALNATDFWNNITHGVSAISEVPSDRWDPTIYYSEDPNEPDKTYSKIGGWIKNYTFDRKLFRMPPTVVSQTDPTQLITLSTVHEALEDAGYIDKDFDRGSCAVILGNAMGGDQRDYSSFRIQLAQSFHSIHQALKKHGANDEEILHEINKIKEETLQNIPPITEDTMPGELSNVISGRVAQIFDFKGPNYTSDAACASSLAAIQSAVDGLQTGRYRMCISGGADMIMSAATFVKFSKIGALSPDGSRPFDANANGFVMGEGVAILILKRLDHAIEDGDKIYAVIKGIGGASDGRGKGITAPNPVGQKLAVARAYKAAGVNPNTVGLLEAHGTSTPVGDPVEFNSIKEVFEQDSTTPGRIAFGSVKSMIGHLKSAAAAAAMVKVAYALKHKTLPPTINLKELNPKIQIEGTPFSPQLEAEPWERGLYPRRAGISAFGFGGTNFHVVLEEYDPESSPNGSTMTSYPKTDSGDQKIETSTTTESYSTSKQSKINIPESEGIIGIYGNSIDDVRHTFTQFCNEFEKNETSIERFKIQFKDTRLAHSGVRLAIAFTSYEDLRDKLLKVMKSLEKNKGWKILANQGVFFSEAPEEGKVAMLFPGQGSQYLNMGGELKRRFGIIQETLEEADRIMQPILNKPLTSLIFPSKETDEMEAFLALSQTEVTQPAVLALDVSILNLLKSLGIKPDVVAGHSLGEYGACVAAEVMSFEEALTTVAARGTEMANATPMNGDCGLMAAVNASVDEVTPILESIDSYIVCANINCPTQTIIAGLTEAVEQAIEIFKEKGLSPILLPVSHAFHSKVVASASVPLRKHLSTINIKVPTTPILTNVTGDFYPSSPTPETPNAIRDLLAEQVAAPVEFIRLINNMYNYGARVFIEVGPKRAQSAFVSSILDQREHHSLHTNHPKNGELQHLYYALAKLWSLAIWQKHFNDELVHHTPESHDLMVPEKREQSIEKYEAYIDFIPQNKEKTTTSVALNRDDVLKVMVEVLCDKTGYDPDEIDTSYELEADLGVDTVKQAEIMAELRERYSLPRDESFKFSEHQTLEALADYTLKKASGAGFSHSSTEQPTASLTTAQQVQPIVKSEESASKDATATTTATATGATSNTVSATIALNRDDVLKVMVEVLCDKTGYDPDEIDTSYELEADLGVDTVKQAEIMAELRERYSLPRDESFKFSEHQTLNALADYILQSGTGGTSTSAPVQPVAKVEVIESPKKFPVSEVPQPAAGGEKIERIHEVKVNRVVAPMEESTEVDTVISGTAIGLPGIDEMFAENAIDELLNGTNMITPLSHQLMKKMVDKNIVRLVKKAGGGGEMEKVTQIEEVIKLAGQRKHFDLKEFGVDERLIKALDLTSQYAIAAGLLALRDAKIPLVPKYQTTRTGDKITRGWGVPQELADRTGIIFASAFAGQDALIEELEKSHQGEYTFNHRYLLLVLGIANSRLAEYLNLRGPNTKINNACASTTTAIAMARDWIRLGHCDRVVVLAADDASAENSLMEWVASGFLATGAANIESDVTKAALPFDKRRNGMIIGMGAVSLIVERAGLPEQRGLEPVADILETHFVNSGFHPTRLDVNHIASQVDMLIHRAEKRFHLDRHEMAKKMVFVSHETYTPRRGGSAAAEIESIRRTFGTSADQVVIANTKGFTGHAMGAGLEDVLAVKALQNQRLPHIANFKEPDPDLGNLRLSQGGAYPLDYALRLAAGFGSQLALILFRKRATTEDRIFDEGLHQRWLAQVTGFQHPESFVENRVLKTREGSESTHIPQVETPTPPHTGISTPSAQPWVSSTPLVAVDLGNKWEPKAVVSEAYTTCYADPEALKTYFAGKRFAILSGPHPAAQMIQTALNRCNAHAIHYRPKGTQNGFSDPSLFIDFESPIEVEEQLAKNRVDGVINLLGFSNAKFDDHAIYTATKRTFLFAKAWFNHLKTRENRNIPFISITNMGGRLGFTLVGNNAPIAGGVAGFTKALAREWNDINIKVIDIPSEGFYPQLGLRILKTIADDRSNIEIGLSGQECFTAITTSLDKLKTAKSLEPLKEDVIVVTGGAKGITAEIVKDLAKRYQCKFALIGRTPITYPDPTTVDESEERARLKAELEKEHERVTPIMLRKALAPLQSQKTIIENMKIIDAYGSPVAYFNCDMANEAEVAEVLQHVKDQFGRIDGIIHGAGVEESKQLEDKNLHGFNRVFKGKALGATYLWKHAPDKLKFFITFGSVAGRFGNPGQVDYSAANEVMNKLVATINEYSETAGIAIDWTAWDEVGMASDPAMRMLLVQRGIDLLPLNVGTPIVGNLLAQGIRGEVLVAGNLGDFESKQTIPQTHEYRPSNPEGTTSEKIANILPMADEILEMNDEKVVISRSLDLSKDYFLNDHRYEGNPVVPGVMGYQMMAEAAHLLLGETNKDLTATDVQFSRAIKLHHDEPVQLKATATLEKGVDGEPIASVVVTSVRTSKTGREIVAEHFSALFVGRRGDEENPKTLLQDRISPHDHWKQGLDQAHLYRHYFHTGVFQVIENIIGYTDNAILGIGSVPLQAFSSIHPNHAFFTDPMVREMAFQVAGYWGMVTQNRSYLPLAIESSETFAKARPGMPLIIRCARREDAQEHAIAFDIEVFDEKGKLLQRLTKCELIGHRALELKEIPPVGEPLIYTQSAMSVPEARAYLQDRQINIDSILFQNERQALDRLLSERRRGEWVAARISVKVLVQQYMIAFCGEPSSLADIEIAKHESGAPYIRLHGPYPDLPIPNLSITHSAGLAMAAVAGPGPNSLIGLDLETIENRDPAFAYNYFLDSELAIFEKLTAEIDLELRTFVSMLWSMKEAVSKVLGVGLNIKLDDVRIIDISPYVDTVDHTVTHYDVKIELVGEAKNLFDTLGGRELIATVASLGRFVLSKAQILLKEEASLQKKHVNIVQRATEDPNEKKSTTEGDIHARQKLAAVAALFRHKGLISGQNPPTESTPLPNVDIPSWKS